MVRRLPLQAPQRQPEPSPELEAEHAGTKKDPTLRTKAAETFGLLLFSQAMATKFGGKFGPDQKHITRLVMEVMSTEALQD